MKTTDKEEVIETMRPIHWKEFLITMQPAESQFKFPFEGINLEARLNKQTACCIFVCLYPAWKCLKTNSFKHIIH